MSQLEANELQDELYDRFWYNQFPEDEFVQNLFRYTTIGRMYYLNQWDRNDEMFLIRFGLSDTKDKKQLFHRYCQIQTGDLPISDVKPYPNGMIWQEAKREYGQKFNQKVTI